MHVVASRTVADILSELSGRLASLGYLKDVGFFYSITFMFHYQADIIALFPMKAFLMK